MSDPKVMHDYDRDPVDMGESPSAAHSAFKQGADYYADEVTCNPPRRNHPGFKEMQKMISKKPGMGMASPAMKKAMPKVKRPKY